MSDQLTIAVINRGGGDPKLIDTLKNALAVANGATVALVMDGRCKLPELPSGVEVRWANGEPKGTSWARHFAVVSSDTPYVITADSHVVMPADIAAVTVAHLSEHASHVCCYRCEMLPDGGIYQGARLNTCVPPDPRQGSTNKLEGEFQGIAAQWRPGDERAGPITAIMGGCYAIARSWYDDCGQPWQYGRGWGCDEETISIASQANGGKCWLMPQIVGHWMQRSAKYHPKPYDNDKVWANRMRIVETAPMDEEEREHVKAFLLKSEHFKRPQNRARMELVLSEVDIEKAKMANEGGYTLAEIRKELPMRRPELITALRQNNVKGNLARMKIADLQKLYDELPRTMEKPAPIKVVAVAEPVKEERNTKARANYGANENRRTCHNCGSTASRCYDTKHYPRLTKRYRECLDCGRKRVTTEPVK